MPWMIVPIAAAMAVSNVAQPVAPTLRRAQIAASPSSSAKALDPKSVAAAADVVRRFGALLEARRFKAARTLWSGAGAQTGLSEARFVAAYGRYAVIHAKVGPPGQSEGGAATGRKAEAQRQVFRSFPGRPV